MTWPGECINVAVNLSPVRVQEPRALAHAEKEALTVSSSHGNRLELEITGAGNTQSSATTLTALHELHGLGARVSLDDFGTGYSSH